MRALQKKSTDELFELLLKKVSSAEIKLFLKEEGGNIPALKNCFILRFIESATIPSEEKYRTLVQALREVNAGDSKRFNEELSRLVEKAFHYLDGADFLDAFLIASAFIGGYSDFERSEQTAEAFRQLLALLASLTELEAGYELKEQVFRFLLNEVRVFSAALTLEETNHWLSSLMASARDENQLQQVQELLVQLTGENRSRLGETMNEPLEELLLTMKHRLLLRKGQRAEAHQLLKSYKRIKTFRLQLIREHMAQRQWAEAKELIKEGHRRESGKGNISVSAKWEELLLQIALEENDSRAIRNLALQLFLSGEYDFRYYRLLKQHYDPLRWKMQPDRIVAAIRKDKAFSTSGLYAVAEIFAEEEEWEKLLMLLDKNASLQFVDRYADRLREKFPESLLEIYRKAIRRFAEKYMGIEAYGRVTGALKRMLLLPNSKSTVQSLLIELKVTYRSRKAFVKELNKVVL
jgi:hypothetical protein